MKNIIFIDIETVPQYSSYSELSPREKKLWDKKAGFIKKNEESETELYQKAGIYAEFGKIICISAAVKKKQNNEEIIRIKSFYGEDEKQLLEQFTQMITDYEKKQQVILCAHNGKEFDFPYIARRLLINGIKLPDAFQMAGKKPWEIVHIDTMELWRFGDYKSYTSLELLTSVFDIPSPKNDIDGSMVAKVYYEDQDLNRIRDYCQNDVIAIIQLLNRYEGKSLISEENIEIIES